MTIKFISASRRGDKVTANVLADGQPVTVETWFSNISAMSKAQRRAFIAAQAKAIASAGSDVDLSGPDIDV